MILHVAFVPKTSTRASSDHMYRELNLNELSPYT